MDDGRRLALRLTSTLLLLAQVAGAAPAFAATAPATPAPAPVKASTLMPKAQGYYRDARYDEAIGLLSGPVLHKQLVGADLREARLLMARCYVKKGMTPRAKEYFGAVVAAEPAYAPEKGKLDDEELAVFNSVKGVSAPPIAAAVPVAKAAEGKTTAPATPASQPAMHKPEVATESESKPGWLSRNKYLALGLLVAGGVAVGLAAGGGGDSGSSPPPGPTGVPAFPTVPGGH
jgi:hypothetical protein